MRIKEKLKKLKKEAEKNISDTETEIEELSDEKTELVSGGKIEYPPERELD